MNNNAVDKLKAQLGCITRTGKFAGLPSSEGAPLIANGSLERGIIDFRQGKCWNWQTGMT